MHSPRKGTSGARLCQRVHILSLIMHYLLGDIVFGFFFFALFCFCQPHKFLEASGQRRRWLLLIWLLPTMRKGKKKNNSYCPLSLGPIPVDKVVSSFTVCHELWLTVFQLNSVIEGDSSPGALTLLWRSCNGTQRWQICQAGGWI